MPPPSDQACRRRRGGDSSPASPGLALRPLEELPAPGLAGGRWGEATSCWAVAGLDLTVVGERQRLSCVPPPPPPSGKHRALLGGQVRLLRPQSAAQGRPTAWPHLRAVPAVGVRGGCLVPQALSVVVCPPQVTRC